RGGEGLVRQHRPVARPAAAAPARLRGADRGGRVLLHHAGPWGRRGNSRLRARRDRRIPLGVRAHGRERPPGSAQGVVAARADGAVALQGAEPGSDQALPLAAGSDRLGGVPAPPHARLGRAGEGPRSTGIHGGAQSMTDKKDEQVVETATGLGYVDLVQGSGAQPKTGDTVSVHYTGWLKSGTKFDSSVDRGTPFELPVGKGRVIKGWDEGVISMKVGGKRKLIIPAHLGYGDRGAGGVIPGGATLIFEVELLGIRPA